MSKRDKADIYAKTAAAAGNNAPLQTKTAEPKANRSKTLKSVPSVYFNVHAQLKADNKTSLDFSAYILEALREKLERDGAI
ncbi:TPA: chaperonin [Enterobacter roggenkampii]|uniref:chaperonin n=1 Tax=Enterobacter roggenkampii TaxID=1812935 RepID=UPI0037853995